MDYGRVLIAIWVMAVVTYLSRVVTLVLFQKKIHNAFIQSFLFYIPYGVLAAMVFPSILYSTESLLSAVCGMIVALALAYRKKGLLPVSLCSTAVVFAVEQILKFASK